MGHARRLGSLLLLSLLGSPLAPAAPPSPPAASTLLPEGIADAAGRTGFFTSAAGGIEAIDLANGKVLWQTHEAQRPLLLDGNHLLAQAGVKRNRLRILRFDLTRQGECDLESDPVVLPAWVVTGEASGRSFAAHWRLEKHHLVLDWEASAWYVGKGRPTPEETTAARKHAAGIARIDLRSGQIDIRPAENKQAPPPPPLPEHLERQSIRWQGLVDQQRKVLALEEKNGLQRFVLHSWDRRTRTEQEAKELLCGKRLLARVTLDERILCLREASPSPDERASLSPSKSPSWWLLFSVRTGQQLGRLPDEAGMHSIAVLGQRVFYLAPGTLYGALDQPNVQGQILRVFDLATGKKLWQQPVAGKLIAPPPP